LETLQQILADIVWCSGANLAVFTADAFLEQLIHWSFYCGCRLFGALMPAPRLPTFWSPDFPSLVADYLEL